MTGRRVVIALSRLEARQLADLIAQFTALLEEPVDPALARLTPDAYPDDPDAADEFRRATQRELRERREIEGLRMLADLAPAFEDDPDGADPASSTIAVELDEEAGWTWLRTLAAVRLVIAARLGIRSEDDHRPGDDRFAVYDWIGYRLDGLVEALGAGGRPDLTGP